MVGVAEMVSDEVKVNGSEFNFTVWMEAKDVVEFRDVEVGRSGWV